MLRVLFAVAFLVAAASAAELDLDDSNFDSTIKENDYVLTMFFAPWCGHCKSLKPKFTEAAEQADKEGKFKLSKVDCTADDAKALCERYEVKGYPTLKFFKKGEAVEYNGPRETAGILAWLEKKSGPAAVTLSDAAAVKEFAAKAGAIIGYFDGESAAQKAFFKAAGSGDLDDFPAGQVLDKKLFGSRKAGDVTFATPDGEKTFEAGTDGDALAKKLFEASFPLVGEVSGENFQKYVTLGRPLYLLFVEPTDTNKDQLVADLKKVAAKHPEESFTWIDAVKYKAQVKGMGGGDQVPCIIRMSSFTSSNKPIVLDKEGLNEAIIGEWVEGIASGKYKYVPKSEPVPEKNDGPVYTLVGKNWDDLMAKRAAGASVFIEFYAPWCGHCKKLAPVWKELGEKFAANKDKVIIAQVDATANDIEAGAEVRGFPTLLFYKGGSTDAPESYNGGRELDALSKFVSSKIGSTGAADADKEDL